MPQELGRRGFIVLDFVDCDIEFEAPFLALFLVHLDIFGLDPAVYLGGLVTAVPDADLVDVPSLGVVDHLRAGGEVGLAPFKIASVRTVAIPKVFGPLTDLVIYGGDEVFDSY